MKINSPGIVPGGGTLDPTNIQESATTTKGASVQKPQYGTQVPTSTTEATNDQQLNSANAILLEIAQSANLNDPNAAASAIRAATEQIIGWQLTKEFRDKKAWKELTEELAELIGGEEGDPNLRKKIFSILTRMKNKDLGYDVG